MGYHHAIQMIHIFLMGHFSVFFTERPNIKMIVLCMVQMMKSLPKARGNIPSSIIIMKANELEPPRGFYTTSILIHLMFYFLTTLMHKLQHQALEWVSKFGNLLMHNMRGFDNKCIASTMRFGRTKWKHNHIVDFLKKFNKGHQHWLETGLTILIHWGLSQICPE